MTCDAETIRLVIGYNDESDSLWAYEAGPLEHTADDHTVVEVPATMWQRVTAASAEWGDAIDAIATQAGLDHEGRPTAPCPEWVGEVDPVRSWWTLVLDASGRDDEWPLRDADLCGFDNEADAETFMNELPSTFVAVPGYGKTHIVDKTRVSIDCRQSGGWSWSCELCGRSRGEHPFAGTQTDAIGHPFIDPVSGREMVLHFGQSPGVEHPDCPNRAEVTPELDCFYCTHCGWNGRISGAWFMELRSNEGAP